MLRLDPSPPALLRGGASSRGRGSFADKKPFGGVSSLTYGNGLPRTVSYDQQYRITAIDTPGIQSLTYLPDPNGNYTSITNNLDPARNKTFGYDALDRLQTATGPWGNLGFSYDGVGNRLTYSAPEGTSTYSYQPGTNRLASITAPQSRTFGYDASGNITTENARTYVYDQKNRMIQAVEGPPLGEYTQNANQQRAIKTAGGSTTVFHFDTGGQIIAETLPAGTVVAEYIQLNGQPLAKVNGPTIEYVHPDHLGTPAMMTSSAGSNVWEIEARPFGDGATITGGATLNLRFPGQYADQETGLNQNWWREYQSAIGRYTQADPMLYLPLGSNHLYAYVENDPVNFADPYGLFKQAPGVPPVTHPDMLRFLQCMDNCTGREQTITATTNGKHLDPGHAAGTSVDVRPTGTPSAKMFCCAAKCGAKFALDERKLMTKFGTGPHFHFQLVPPANPDPKRNALPPQCMPQSGPC